MTHPLVEELSEDQCWEELRGQSFGRIALSTDSRIVVTPIRYVIVNGSFYFQTVSREKLKSIVISRMATLEIDSTNEEGALKSVTARGTANWHTHEIGIPELDVVRLGPVPETMNWVEFAPDNVSGHILTPQKTD